MEILVFGMVIATVGIAAAALGGIFAIYGVPARLGIIKSQ